MQGSKKYEHKSRESLMPPIGAPVYGFSETRGVVIKAELA